MSSFLITESGLLLTTESGQDLIIESEATAQGIQFISKTQGGASFAWDFGDGTTSTLENPRHLYPASGAWVATLTAFTPGGLQSTIQRAVITLPCAAPLLVPLMVVTVNGTELGYGGLYDNLVFFGESVDNVIEVVISNFGAADLVVTSITIPYEASNPTNPDWYNFTPPAYPLTIPVGGSHSLTLLSTPGVGVNQLGQALGHLTIASNDFVHPHWVGNLYAQCRWYAEFYTTVPDLLIDGQPYLVQTNFGWAAGTRITVLGDGALPPYAVGQCPPCSGDMVFHIEFDTQIAPPARVDVGTINLQDVVGAWELSPQTFDFLDNTDVPKSMDIIVSRPAIPALNRAQFVVPSNLRQDGLPWILSLYCDWRVATSTAWSLIGWDSTSHNWVDGATIDVNTFETGAWACSAVIKAFAGPVHPDTTTIVFTPTHTEPGSTGAWSFLVASMSVDHDNAPTLYTYPFRVIAPFLADNAVPQTADLTITVRNNDCTFQTRTVHMRFFGDNPVENPVVQSRVAVSAGFPIPGPGPVILVTATAPGPGPDGDFTTDPSGYGLLFSSCAVIPGSSCPYYSCSIGLVVTGTGPITYQWQSSNFGVTWVSLTDGAFYSGTTTATLYVGSPTPGVCIAGPGAPWIRCIVTGPSGSTICQPVSTGAFVPCDF